MIPIVKLLTLNKVLCTTNYEYMLITNRLITENGWMDGINYLGEFESMRWRIYSYPNRGPPLIEYPPIITSHYIPCIIRSLILTLYTSLQRQQINK